MCSDAGHVGRRDHQRKHRRGPLAGSAEDAGIDPPLRPMRLEPLRLVHFLDLHGENSNIAGGLKRPCAEIRAAMQATRRARQRRSRGRRRRRRGGGRPPARRAGAGAARYTFWPVGPGPKSTERVLDTQAGYFDAGEVRGADADGFGQFHDVVAAQERFGRHGRRAGRSPLPPSTPRPGRRGSSPPACRPGLINWTPWFQTPSPPRMVSTPSTMARSMGRTPHQVRHDARDPVARVARRFGVQLLRHAGGRLSGSIVAHGAALAAGVLIAAGAAIAAVERAGRDAEVVLQRHGHAGEPVVLELGHGDVDVAVGERVVQVVGGEDVADRRAPSCGRTAWPVPCSGRSPIPPCSPRC